MTDRIAGYVISVINGNTFVLNLTQHDLKNKEQYQNKERVRIANFPLGLEGLSSEQAKKALELTLVDRTVVCDVQSRDSNGELVCDVFFRKET